MLFERIFVPTNAADSNAIDGFKEISSNVHSKLIIKSATMVRRKKISIDQLASLNIREELLLGSSFQNRFVEFSNKTFTLASRLIFIQKTL